MGRSSVPRRHGPADPTPRTRDYRLDIDGTSVCVADDSYSDRIRCDHPEVEDGGRLGSELLTAASEQKRGRIVLLCRPQLADPAIAEGFHLEAEMPGFYRGGEPCVVLGAWPDEARGSFADGERARMVEDIVRKKMSRSGTGGDGQPHVSTQKGTEDDAEEIAALLTETFEYYPTPSGVPEYIRKQIGSGIPFRLIRKGGRLLACASADLEREAKTAELTDCATRPEERGRGLMQSLLLGLMEDLREMDFPTAFTLARASVVGVNLAFARLGFEYRGRMRRSCRIGEGIEDINVWSRRL